MADDKKKNGRGEIDALLASAREALEAGRADAALAEAQAALDLEPRSARALSLCGRAMQNMGDLEGATEALEQSVSLDDSDLETALALARLQWRQGRGDDALALVNFILLEGPDSPQVRGDAEALRKTIADRSEKKP